MSKRLNIPPYDGRHKLGVKQPVKPVTPQAGGEGLEGRGRKPRMVVYFSIWKEPMLWTYDDDHEKVEFSRCQQARDYAAARGHVGIQIKSPPRKGR